MQKQPHVRPVFTSWSALDCELHWRTLIQVAVRMTSITVKMTQIPPIVMRVREMMAATSRSDIAF
jgi:hypothetical protein